MSTDKTLPTVINNIRKKAEELETLLSTLLSDHSNIYMWNTPGGGVVIISGRGDFAYEELDNAGRQVQTQLLEKYHAFQASISILT